MADYILAIDQGTTGSRAFIINPEGEIIAGAYSEFTQIFPKPGWVEHNPEEIWEVTVRVIKSALEKAGIKESEIAGIGITNQRETTVLWERKTAKPVYNAIVWQCRRSAGICQKLKEQGWEEKVREKTGLVIDAYFSASKLKWLFDNKPELRQRAEKGELAFGTIDSWLIYRLSGGEAHCTDYTNASRTMLLNIKEKKWDEELLELFGIPGSVLPEVKTSAGIFAQTNCSELPKGVPIAGVAGDQQSALFGQACFEPGLAKNTYGTGSFLLVYLGDELVYSRSGLLTTIACSPEGKPAYALEGSIFITGAVIQWLRDQLGIISSAPESEELAKKVKNNAGVYFVPAFVGLGAPHWDMEARGAILGLTRGASREHIVRSALESIAYQTRDLVEAIENDLKKQAGKISELRVDGGASKNNFLMQFQADILGIAVDRPEQVETTVLGAGYLAGIGIGLWKSGEMIKKLRKTEARFEPSLSPEKREALYQGWQEAVKRVKSKI